MEWIINILIKFPILGFVLCVAWYIFVLVMSAGVVFVCCAVVLFFTTCQDIKMVCVKTAKNLFLSE